MSAGAQGLGVPESYLDHTDQTHANDPSVRFRELLQKCPVGHTSRFGGFWVVSRYDDVVEAARNTEVFSSAEGVSIPYFGATVPLLPGQSDPPEHSFHRRLVQAEFSRGRMREAEESVRALAVELIESFAARGSADLMIELVSPLPAIIMAELMGFPRSDWAMFREQLDFMIEAAITGDPEGAKVAADFMVYLSDTLADRRANPRDDMLTRTVQATIGDRPITEEEALGSTWSTVISGHETTVGGIGALLMHVGRDPELKRRLVEDATLIPKAIEETVRLESPIQGMRRYLTRDVCLRDQQLRKGEDVWISFAAANRDEERFENPDEFDLDRSPNRHLGFGDGIHRCVGMPLAQLEMRVVLEEVLVRLPGLTVEKSAELEWYSTQSRKLLSLPATW